MITEQQLREIIAITEGVYSGLFHVEQSAATLPPVLWKHNYANIYGSFLEGAGVAYELNGDRDEQIKAMNRAKGLNGKLPFFRENVNYFCMAKTVEHIDTLQQYLDLPKEQFIAKGLEVNRTYNELYLSSEYDTAQLVGESVKKWNELVSSDDDLLVYVTKEDNRVRLEHHLLDGVTFRAGSRFAALNTPPNGDRCRCIIRKAMASEVQETNLKAHVKKFNGENNTDFTGVYNNDVRFDFNPAKKQIVFSEESSYFNTWDRYNLDFKKNYGL
jgi:hypothetical protein